MKISLTAAGLLVAGLTLAGCGGGGASSAPSAAAPSTSAGAPASSAPATGPSAASPSPSASSGGGATASVAKVCDVLDADQVGKLTGVKVKKGKSQDLGPSNICQWAPANAGASDAAVFSGQEGPLPGPLSQVEGELKKQFDGSVSKISVSGADDARYIKGKKSGVNVIDVLAAKDDVFYQVLVASPRDVGQHKGAAVKLAEALIEG